MEFKATKDIFINKDQSEGRVQLNDGKIDVWYIPGHFTKEEAESYSRLIESAPRLLEALKEIFEEVNLADYSLDLYKKTEEVIKQATS